MTKLTDLKKRLRRDPEFQDEYAKIDEDYTLTAALVRAREEADLTQGISPGAPALPSRPSHDCKAARNPPNSPRCAGMLPPPERE